VVSIMPSRWPNAHRVASRTSIWRTSPDTFALTVAWLIGISVPDTGSQRDMGVLDT
jgi:hypothetical protein